MATVANDVANRMVWVDLEMTGLDVNKDRIIEMACIITDSHLNIVEEGPNIVIHESDEVFKNMNEWCIEHHGKSGLTEAVRRSEISQNEAENQMLSFISKHVPKGKCPLAGNSVHADKAFLTKYMPHFTAYLHYRIIDVSTIKELCRRWYPDIYNQAPEKGMSHRALDDIKESIKELEFYKKKLFI